MKQMLVFSIIKTQSYRFIVCFSDARCELQDINILRYCLEQGKSKWDLTYGQVWTVHRTPASNLHLYDCTVRLLKHGIFI